MTNPNVALYEELKEEFASKPTRYSMTDDITNLGATLGRLQESADVVLERYHTFREFPTFLFAIPSKETWILIDVLNDSVKVVIRSNDSIDAMAAAFSLVSGSPIDEVTWEDLADLKSDDDDDEDEDDEDPKDLDLDF